MLSEHSFLQGVSHDPPGEKAQVLHHEPHHAVCYVVVVNARHLSVATGPREKYIAGNLYPSLLHCVHASAVGKHAKNLGGHCPYLVIIKYNRLILSHRLKNDNSR